MCFSPVSYASARRTEAYGACALELFLAALFLFAVAFVLAAFVVAFTLVLAALLAFGFAALFALGFAALLTSLGLAAVLGATVDTTLAVVLGAGGVGASALVVAALMVVLAHLGLGAAVNGLLSGSVVAAGSHAESESSSDESG